MGAFVETMEKMKKANDEALHAAKTAMLERHGAKFSDLGERFGEGKWEVLVEQASYGRTKLKLYRLVDAVEVVTEAKVRAVESKLMEPITEDDERP